MGVWRRFGIGRIGELGQHMSTVFVRCMIEGWGTDINYQRL